MRRRRCEGPAGAATIKLQRARQLRAEATRAEAMLWNALRRNALGVKTRRQHVLLGWILDFYIPAARLAIELDGPTHEARTDDDRVRDEARASVGIAPLRIESDRVESSLTEVLREIVTRVTPSSEEVALSPVPSPAAALQERGVLAAIAANDLARRSRAD